MNDPDAAKAYVATTGRSLTMGGSLSDAFLAGVAWERARVEAECQEEVDAELRVDAALDQRAEIERQKHAERGLMPWMVAHNNAVENPDTTKPLVLDPEGRASHYAASAAITRRLYAVENPDDDRIRGEDY